MLYKLLRYAAQIHLFYAHGGEVETKQIYLQSLNQPTAIEV